MTYLPTLRGFFVSTCKTFPLTSNTIKILSSLISRGQGGGVLKTFEKRLNVRFPKKGISAAQETRMYFRVDDHGFPALIEISGGR